MSKIRFILNIWEGSTAKLGVKAQAGTLPRVGDTLILGETDKDDGDVYTVTAVHWLTCENGDIIDFDIPRVIVNLNE